MYELYNNEFDIVKGLNDFFENLDFHLSKPQSKIIPHFITSIINAENITTLDISKVFIDNSFSTNNYSIQKKIWRFLNNPKFDGIAFFNASIKHNF